MKLEKLKEVHEAIRNVLIDYECEEYGDCIIDEISLAVGIDTTQVYSEEKLGETLYTQFFLNYKYGSFKTDVNSRKNANK
jgi:hypothetical protein